MYSRLKSRSTSIEVERQKDFPLCGRIVDDTEGSVGGSFVSVDHAANPTWSPVGKWIHAVPYGSPRDGKGGRTKHVPTSFQRRSNIALTQPKTKYPRLVKICDRYRQRRPDIASIPCSCSHTSRCTSRWIATYTLILHLQARIVNHGNAIWSEYFESVVDDSFNP